MTLLAGLLVHEPLDPTVEEARQLLRDELAKADYADDRSLITRVLEWIYEHVQGISSPGGLAGWALPLVLVIVVAIIVTVVLIKVRRNPARPTGGRASDVLGEARLTADGYRARARAAFAAGDAGAAATDWFRAIAAGAIERALLDDDRGTTAHEIGLQLAAVFPAEADAIASAANLFDGVVYGDVVPDQAQAEQVGALDGRLAAARPQLRNPMSLVGG